MRCKSFALKITPDYLRVCVSHCGGTPNYKQFAGKTVILCLQVDSRDAFFPQTDDI